MRKSNEGPRRRNLAESHGYNSNRYVQNNDNYLEERYYNYKEPLFGVSSHADAFSHRLVRSVAVYEDDSTSNVDSHGRQSDSFTDQFKQSRSSQRKTNLFLFIVTVFVTSCIQKKFIYPHLKKYWLGGGSNIRPNFVHEQPYVSSSYYTSTSSIATLWNTQKIQIDSKKYRMPDSERGISSRLAIVRPFCEFDAEALPTTFACWNSLVPCRAAEQDLDADDSKDGPEWISDLNSFNDTSRSLEDDGDDHWECEAESDSESSINSSRRCKRKPRNKTYFDDVTTDAALSTSADLFLFYSQTFSENQVAIHAVDEIMNEFFSPGGWSKCFDNIYAIEANIPRELDLYIPAAQEELYNWVNGPNRQFEAAFRIIQSGAWGNYDGFYLMEGDSVPVKNYWLDVLLDEVNWHKPFAVLGAQYDGDKWDAFYERIPLSLLHHTNGNGIYNTSHPLLERLVGQLEVEAPSPYNSIPYDYRMSQMWVEGTLGIVPKLAPKIMMNEDGKNITLSDNTAMLKKWANRWQDEDPFRYTKAIHNYASTNLIPRHLGPEYIIHGAKLYSPWDPAKTEITLVISEWFFDRSINLIKNLDSKDHPFSQIIIMMPHSASNDRDYNVQTDVPVTVQFRHSPDFMDLCSAEVTTEWFMITNSYHQVANHVDLMFTPGKFVPVVPFTPATYPFCLKFPYCRETIRLAQRWNPGHKQVVLDMDMLYNTKERNNFCQEWLERNGEDGEDLYSTHEPIRYKLRGEKIVGPKGPTGSDYFAYLSREKKAGMYKMTDRSLYGARAPFVKVYRKEEKLDGMSEDELAKRVGMALFDNATECSCDRFDTEEDCVGSEFGCLWRPLFESCHPPEMIDDGVPICEQTDPPTMSPTVSIEGFLQQTESPTADVGTADESQEGESRGVIEDNRNLLGFLFNSFENRASSTLVKEAELVTPSLGRVSRNMDSPSVGNRFLVVAPIASKDPIITKEISSTQRDAVASSFDGMEMNGDDVFDMFDPLGPDNDEDNCPTWGPSNIPRHIDNLAERASNPQNKHISHYETHRIKKISLARARHMQHQLVQIEPDASLDSKSIQIQEIKKIEVQYTEKIEPLEIVFDTSLLQSEKLNHVVLALIQDILPVVAKRWSDVLTIFQPLQNLTPTVLDCGAVAVPPRHRVNGVAKANVVIYVGFKDPASCSLDSKPVMSICHFDQNMRPLFGSLSICVEDIDSQNGIVYDKENLRYIALITQLTGRFLGLSPKLFKYFRDSETGQPWGERRVQVLCDNSGATKEVLLPNVITQHEVGNTNPYYEISTPTVRQVVRNHFDCQSLTGARLNAPVPDQSENGECIFHNLDLRYHFDEDMTAISQNSDSAFAISPLSLALLEDSSWYKANYEASTNPTFGRSAGCGFVYGDCGVNDEFVSDYSEGFFCNVSNDEIPGSPSGCDYTHQYKANCDANSHDYQSSYDDMHFCPMRSKHLIPCSSTSVSTTFSSFPGESFEENSKCFETDSIIPVCLETNCNIEERILEVLVNGTTFRCRYHGELINTGFGYSFVCPRIAVICPEIICPSNCSGKGMCDYCREVPECICDNLFDETPGCWES